MVDDNSVATGANPPSKTDSLRPVAFERGQMTSREMLLGTAQKILSARAAAFRVLPRHLFRDEAWDMLLELYIAQHQGKRSLVKHLLLHASSIAAGMRRIDAIEEAGLIKRSQNPYDHRCTDVSLTERGLTSLTILLQDIGNSD